MPATALSLLRHMDIYFQNSDLLWLLAVVPVQAGLLWGYWRWRRRTLSRLGSPVLMQRLLQGFSARRFWLKQVLLGSALVALVLAIADPRRQERPVATEGRGADIVLLLDVSASMWARDVSPNRLEQARAFALRAVTALEGHRLGLVLFAGDAFAQLPLSTDYATLRVLLQEAGPDFIARRGTDIGSAIEVGARLFESGSTAGRAMVLITDGEDHEGLALQQVEAARLAGIRLFVISVGRPEGAPVVGPDGAPWRDGSGAAVYSRPNFDLLREMAHLGDGHFWTADQPRAAQQVASTCEAMQKAALTLKAQPRYTYYFIALALACWILLALEQMLGRRTPNTSSLPPS